MPKRVKISTKTTRNTEFNGYNFDVVINPGTAKEYTVNNVLHTVASTTATTANPNIKLLDVNQGIAKSGGEIKADALQNMTLIEGKTGLDTKTAKVVAYYALNGRPDPDVDPTGAALYDKLAAALASEDLTFDKIKETMLINYDDEVLADNSTYYIYGAPEQQVLNNRQHYNNCGIESTLNNLAMAGIIKMKENLSDQEKVEKSFLQSVWERNLAGDFGQVGVLDQPDGGTLVDDYRDILEYFGIDAHSYYITNKCDGYVYPKEQLKELAYKISQGHGAVLGLSSSKLWNDVQSETGKIQIDHAVAITGVVYDADGPVKEYHPDGRPKVYNTPVGFYIHDTGAWMTRFISYKDFVDVTLCDYVYGETATDTTLPCLKEYDSKTDTYILKSQQGIFVAITDEPIKTDVFNLDATGDKLDNIIWGNSSDNVIKGMNGNDTLYGGAGRDTLYGGNGNDTIVGNNAFTFTANIQNPHVSVTYNTIEDFKGFLADAGVLDDVEQRLDAIQVEDFGTKDFADFAKAYEYIREHVPNGINTLDGGAGNDIIIGGEQADLIYGGKGSDYIYGGDGRNAIYGGANDDVIVGGYDNDRLFGDAGNDIIYGLDDMDTIDGGAGNDIIFGGSGNDIIETGKGNDMVYFEGTEFGQDTVMSKAGSTIFKFVEDGDTKVSKVTDFFFSLKADEENNKVKNLTVQYRQGKLEDDENGITFGNYLTVKSGKTKSLYVADEDGIYTTAVSKKAKATVTNTKETGSVKIFGQSIENKDINNILMTTYEGAKITTSTKNDIVTMINNGNPLISTKADSIEYTGGRDKYVSEDRDTNYTVGALTNDTKLSIYDNVIGVTKVITDEEGHVDTDDNYASKNDKLYTSTKSGDINLFFDVQIGDDDYGYTTENSGFYILNKDNMKAGTFSNIALGNELAGGFIYMDSFLGYDYDTELGKGYAIAISPGEEPDFYGNGRVEHFICDNTDFAYTERVVDIASDVAGWLNSAANTKGYTSAFDVFSGDDDASITALTQIYESQGAS